MVDKYGPAVSDYFNLWLDGTYMLVGDAQKLLEIIS
jgi:hypothetical protein